MMIPDSEVISLDEVLSKNLQCDFPLEIQIFIFAFLEILFANEIFFFLIHSCSIRTRSKARKGSH